MEKTLCQKCFHYEACTAIDLSGTVGNPEYENEPCGYFVDADKVLIQEKANWIEKVERWSDGHACVKYNCSRCEQREKVRIYEEKEWENYYSEHYRDGVEMPNFCKVCGSAMNGIVEEE